MTQAWYSLSKELFPGSDLVRGYRFKADKRGENCALLARANHQLAQAFSITGEKSALLAVVRPIRAAIAGLAGENCALLARANHQLAQAFSITGEKSALLDVVRPIRAAIAGLTGVKSVHFCEDCFECLTPREAAG